MLGRPLFTDSLALPEFAAVDERRRGELVVGWASGSLSELEAIIRHAHSPGEDVSDELVALGRRRAGLEAYARSNGFGTKQWRPDDHAKTLAEKHGRGEEYAALLVTHQFVHGSIERGLAALLEGDRRHDRRWRSVRRARGMGERRRQLRRLLNPSCCSCRVPDLRLGGAK
jgi:hypothetical protein